MQPCALLQGRALLMVIDLVSFYIHDFLLHTSHFVNLCMKHKMDRARSYETGIFKMAANSLQMFNLAYVSSETFLPLVEQNYL
jgi:hypothetical protein